MKYKDMMKQDKYTNDALRPGILPRFFESAIKGAGKFLRGDYESAPMDTNGLK